jgi:hypothetical protein
MREIIYIIQYIKFTDEEIMTKDRKNKSEPDKNKIREPETDYKTLNVSTLDELKEMHREHTRNLSPKERLHYLYRLNENLYGFDMTRQEETLRRGEIVIRIRS